MTDTVNPMFEQDAKLDARVDALYNLVKGKIDWANPIPMCMEIAKELEGMTELKGAQRLELLQKTLKFALKDSDLPAEQKDQTILFIDNVLPIVMQAAVLASKSPLIAQTQAACWNCFVALRSSKK